MSWRSDWPHPDVLASHTAPGEQRRGQGRGPAELAARLRRSLRGPAGRRDPPRRPLNPVLIEEEAIAHLYGSRTGTVSPSTTRAPVSQREQRDRSPARGASRQAGTAAGR